MKKKQSRREFCKNCLLVSLAMFSCGKLSSRENKIPAESDSQEKEEKMKEMIACCGLVCTKCPAYIATQKNDDELRKKTSESWSKMFGAEIKPESINCDGCLSNTHRLFGYCLECKIRKCCQERKLANCAECQDYGCEKLMAFFNQAPEAKAKLEELRRKKS